MHSWDHWAQNPETVPVEAQASLGNMLSMSGRALRSELVKAALAVCLGVCFLQQVAIASGNMPVGLDGSARQGYSLGE